MKKRYFSLAKKLSKKSDHRFQMGSVVVRGSKVLGIGFNNARKSHPRAKTPYNTIHAELSAVLSAGREDLQGSDMYIYRETRDGKPANSFPCGHCLALINDVGIRNIYYTKDGAFVKA